MKKKFFYLLMSAVLSSILMSACSTKRSKEEEKVNIKEYTNKEEKTLASKEFLMITFSITEKDIENLPVDEILSYYKITEEDLLETKQQLVNPSDITNYLKLLQKDIKEEKRIKEEYGTIDFKYILEAKEYTGNLPDIESIRYLVDSYNIGTGGYSCVIDFEKNKIYYQPNAAGVCDDIRYAEKVIDLTSETKEEIIGLLEDVKLGDWKYKYDEYRGEGGEECFWEFGVEFNDGTIVSNYGIYGDSPDEYITLRDILYDKIIKNLLEVSN